MQDDAGRDGDLRQPRRRRCSGRSLEVAFPTPAPPPADAPVVLAVRGLTPAAGASRTSRSRCARARSSGSPASSAAAAPRSRARSSAPTRATRRRSSSTGASCTTRSPRGERSAAGIALLPESRKDQGLRDGPRRSNENVTMAHVGDGLAPRRARSAGASSARRGRHARSSVDARTGLAVAAGLVAVGRQPAEGRAAPSGWSRRRGCCSPTSRRAASTSAAKRAIYDLIHGLAADGLGGAADLLRARGGARARASRDRRCARAGSWASTTGDQADEETVMRAVFGSV